MFALPVMWSVHSVGNYEQYIEVCIGGGAELAARLACWLVHAVRGVVILKECLCGQYAVQRTSRSTQQHRGNSVVELNGCSSFYVLWVLWVLKGLRSLLAAITAL